VNERVRWTSCKHPEQAIGVVHTARGRWRRRTAGTSEALEERGEMRSGWRRAAGHRRDFAGEGESGSSKLLLF